MTRQIKEGEPHRDKVIKLIPAEIVAAYLVIEANLIQLGEIVIWVAIAIEPPISLDSDLGLT